MPYQPPDRSKPRSANPPVSYSEVASHRQISIQAGRWEEYDEAGFLTRFTGLRLVWRVCNPHGHHDVVIVDDSKQPDDPLYIVDKVYHGIDAAGSRLAFIAVLAAMW